MKIILFKNMYFLIIHFFMNLKDTKILHYKKIRALFASF